MTLNKQRYLLFASKLSSALIILLSYMLLSRFLPKDQYGNYRQLLMVTQIISSLLILGLPSGTIYFLSNKVIKEKQRIMMNIFAFKGLLVTTIVILIYPLSLLFDELFKTSFYTENIVIILLILIGTIFVSDIENFLIVEKQTNLLIKYVLINNSIYFILLLFGILNKSNLIYFLWILSVKYIISSLNYMYILRFKTKYRIRKININYKEIKKIFYFILPLGLTSMVGILSTNIDKIMIGYYFNSDDFAIISNAAYELPFISLLGTSVFSVMIPILKKRYDEKRYDEVAKIWYETGKNMSLLMVPLGIVMLIFSKEIMIVLYSEKYIDGSNIFGIYQLRNIFRIFLYGTIFIVLGETKKILVNTFISGIVNIILNIIFIKLFGLIGVAYATFTTLIILVLLQNYQISRILSVKLVEIYPIKVWSLIIIISYFFNKSMYIILLNFMNNNISKTLIIVMVYVLNVIIVNLLFNIKNLKIKGSGNDKK